MEVYDVFLKNKKMPIPDDREHTICNTGHRPKSLPWGYNEDHPACIKFKEDLYNILEKSIQCGYKHFITGMALGVDMMFAETIIKLKKKYKDITLEGAIPCCNQDQGWPSASQKRYLRIKKECDFMTLVSQDYSKDCMNKRNKYMVEKSAVVIAVWNGKPSGTGNTVRFAKEQGCKIRRINPEDYITE